MISSEHYLTTQRLHGSQRRHRGLVPTFGLKQCAGSHIIWYLVLCMNLATGLHGAIRVMPPCKLEHVDCNAHDASPKRSPGGKEDQLQTLLSNHDLTQQSRLPAFLPQLLTATTRALTSISPSLAPPSLLDLKSIPSKRSGSSTGTDGDALKDGSSGSSSGSSSGGGNRVVLEAPDGTATAPPNAFSQSGSISSPAPAAGGRDSGGSDGGGGGGTGKKHSTTIIIIIAVIAGTAGLAAAVILAIVLVRLWRRWRRRQDSQILDSEATTGERTFDSISSVSLSGTAKELPEDSARFNPVAAEEAEATPPPPLAEAKRDCLESTPFYPSSSKSLGSYPPRPCSSVYGGESVLSGGATGVMALRASSTLPFQPSAPAPTSASTPAVGMAAAGSGMGIAAVRASDSLRPSWRQYSVHSGGSDRGGGGGGGGNYSRGSNDGGAEPGLRPSWPGQVHRRGAFSWEPDGRLASTSARDDNFGGDGAAGTNASSEPCGALADALPAAPGSSMGRCSRPTGGSMVSASAITAGGWYDLFALEGTELAGVVTSGRPTTSARVGGPAGLAARRRRRSSDSTQILRRSRGEDTAAEALPPSSPRTASRDGDIGGGSRGSGSGSRSPLPPSQRMQPGSDTDRYMYTDRAAAAAAVASSRSPLTPRTHKPTGSEPYGLNEDSPYDGVRLGDGSSAAAADSSSSNSPGHPSVYAHSNRDLLRVQSRRPAFSDRTRGTLAAAVTTAVTSPCNGGGDAAVQPSVLHDISTRLEPRRGGFIHGNSISPYIVIPPLHMSFIRSQNCTGSVTAGISGGGSGPGSGGYAAWPPAASGQNSPCCSFGEGRTALTGDVGGRRRNSGCNVVGHSGNSYLVAAGKPGDLPTYVTAQPMQTPPSSASESPSAAEWVGGLSCRARSEMARRSTSVDHHDMSRTNATAAAARGDHGIGGGSGGGLSPAAALKATAAVESSDLDPVCARYNIRRPPRVQTSDAVVNGSDGGDGSPHRRSRAAQSGTGGRGHVAATAIWGQQQTGPHLLQLPEQLFNRTSAPSPSPCILSPLQPSLALEAAEAVTAQSHGSSVSMRPPAGLSVSVSRLTGAGYRTAPAAPINVDMNRSISPCSHNSTSGSADGGADGGDGAATGRRIAEELSPAFGPTAAMRARQMVKRSSSCGSSDGGTPYGMGGLVDSGVEANAETGAARLAMMKRLAVGPPRPAWGLIHAGIGPLKRSIASVQNARNKVDAGLSDSLTPAAVAAAAASVAAAPSAAAARGPRSSVPGRMLLSGSSSAAGDLSATSSLASGPFLRLVAEK
ncbi:hypothetical protein Vafri_6247 [Volvox africanus]|uniref:Uncharacterized protein n=1 Tax=Volvox africanus TaxID=51714 RepID=A0A8J4AXK7_9CHLO|nr:hypothetical protein Vafri_6247 [Volvox africanus]